MFCYLLGQERDEVPLKHRFKKCIDCAVLVVLHALEQLLHELYLVLLSPRGEVIQANLPLLQIPEKEIVRPRVK